MARGEAESQSRAPHEDRSDPGAESGRSVNAFNPEYVEALYLQWKSDQSSVSEDWNRFFLGFELGLETSAEPGTIDPPGIGAETANTKQGRVDALIYQYRDIGHLAAQLDPLGGHRPFPDELTLEALTLMAILTQASILTMEAKDYVEIMHEANEIQQDEVPRSALGGGLCS